MLRLAMLAALVSCCGFLTGCCSGPCGPGGGGGCGGGIPVGYGGCGGDDCGGSGWNHRQHAGGPLASLQSMKKRMVCGSGCGETYYGEWRSHPPDCTDPCEFDYTYHGGGIGGGCGNCGGGGCGGCCGPCNFSPPPRRRPLVGIFRAVYGDRYCEGCDSGCNDCQGGGYYEGGGGYGGGDCGCASNSQGNATFANTGRQQPMMARGNMVQGNQTTARSIPEPRRVARQPNSVPSTGRQR